MQKDKVVWATYMREWYRRRRAERPEEHQRCLERQRTRQKNRYHTDPEYRARQIQRTVKSMRGSVKWQAYHRKWKQDHPLSEEQREARKKYMRGYHQAHKPQSVIRHLKRYGLTLEAYDSMVQSQNGKCAVCRKESSGQQKRLHVDHNHTTGKIRGLLCSVCNTVLGLVKENTAVLAAATKYLRRYNEDA